MEHQRDAGLLDQQQIKRYVGTCEKLSSSFLSEIGMGSEGFKVKIIISGRNALVSSPQSNHGADETLVYLV